MLKNKLGHKLIFPSIFILYFLLWSYSNWPALRQPWWYMDDYFYQEGIMSYKQNLIRYTLANGRPIQTLWFFTFWLDATPCCGVQNMILRLIQGMFHSLTALFAAFLFWRGAKHWQGFVSVLPFLLWPFNGEAVLWRSVGFYPLAALLGLMGICIIRYSYEKSPCRSLAGSSILLIAMLTNQAAAFSGLVVWLLLYSLVALEKARFPYKRLLYEGLFVFLGYITGYVLGYYIAQLFGSGRAVLASSFTDKFFYLCTLNRLFITWPDKYPECLAVLHVLLILGAVVFVIGRGLQGMWPVRRALLAILFLLTALVTPYVTLLVVSEDWPAWRVMYLAPFLITGSWNLWDRSLKSLKLGTCIPMVLFGLVLTWYVVMSRINSAEYVRVFEEDIKALRSMESYCEQENIDGRVIVATRPLFLRTWNTYGVRYWHADSKLSVFLQDWTAHAFIRVYSWLEPVKDETLQGECVELCKHASRAGSFQLYKIRDNAVLCVCP